MSRETPEARAERILAELRAATSEAAGLLKDLTKVIAGARAQVEDYLHDECERALNEHNGNLIAELRRLQAEHEAKVIGRVVDFAALIESNFSREALIREAVDRIERQVVENMNTLGYGPAQVAPGVTISLCDRPHAD